MPPSADPQFRKALRDLEAAVALQDQGLAIKADLQFQKVLKKHPDYFDALHLYGLFKYQRGQFDDAHRLIAKALKVNPRSANALNSFGVVLQALGRPANALAAFEGALAINSNLVPALSNRGCALNTCGRFQDALVSLDRALAIDARYVEAAVNRGAAQLALRRNAEALESYDHALKHAPNMADAWFGRGNVLYILKRYGEAAVAYDKAFTLNPQLSSAEGARLHSKMLAADWSHFDTECAHLLSAVRGGKLAASPFVLLSMPATAEDQFENAKRYSASKPPVSDKPLCHGEKYAHGKIRLAYLSADFDLHPVAHLLAGMFEQHDRSRFETFAISFQPDRPGEMLTRLKAAFDRFIDVSNRGDFEIAQLLRSLEIDIAVDLMGYTMNSRPAILGCRPAPIQVSYLGYAATMAAKHIDYIVADRIVLPDEERKYFTEKAVRLPHTFMVSDSKRLISAHTPSRADCGLPENGFVFCAFNNVYKILPKTFDIWMRLLGRIDNAVLWLNSADQSAVRNLRREAENRGIDPARLVFAERVPRNEDHLARHRLADLFLDTLPYNAHSTASDALWAGLPIVTCTGTSFASRVAASLLYAVGLPELVTATPQAYEALAFELATSPPKLAEYKQRLATNRLVAPLFDTARFTRHIDAVFGVMIDRHRAGKAPDHMDLGEQTSSADYMESSKAGPAGEAAMAPAPAPSVFAAGNGAQTERNPNDPASWGKVGRNEECPCGSGKKYKHCHGKFV
ncbi:MAG: tetratricopeptide repeat protein [Pseudolabrys sp.]|nr:tetratricopeptide repeat protein [Pseudolabrys sp.]